MSKEKEYDLLEEALERFDEAQSFYSDNFEKGKEDYGFSLGIGQWDAADEAARKRDGLPCLVLNQLDPYVNQVVNDARQMRPAIRVSPVDDNADIDTAEVFAGIIRNIERQSKANLAYDVAVANAARAGIGWIRVSYDYSSPMSFNYDISIDRVLNFESAMLDPNYTKADGSDAEWAFIFDDYSHEDFEAQFPDANMDGFNHGDWYTDKTIRVAEFYYKEYEDATILHAEYEENGQVIEGVITDKEYDVLIEAGIEVNILDERKTTLTRIKQCLMTQNEILEQTEWVGSYIPLVPVVGQEVFVEGKRQYLSLIAQAKDAQRMYNYWKSCSTAMIALQPKAPFIGAKGQFATYPNEWTNANRINYSFLEYDIVYDENGNPLPPPQRQPPAQGSMAMMQEAESARQDVRYAIGMPQAAMGEKSNEISGIAVRNRQIEGDNAVFHFIDNLTTAITHVGVILVDLIPRLYSGKQIRRILGEDGTEKNVPINQPFVKDKETGTKRRPKQGEKTDGIYRLGVGKYDVVCDVGASYSSKRQEMADKLSELISARPELMDIVGDLVFESLDLPKAKEISDRMKAVMSPDVLADDPQAQKLAQASNALKQMEEKLMQMDALLKQKEDNTQFDQNYKLQELQLDREKFQIEAQVKQAEIAKIMDEINQKGAVKELTDKTIQALVQQVSDLSQAVEIMLDYEEQGQESVEPEKPAQTQELENE